jgi:acyl-CoA dehydrogenase
VTTGTLTPARPRPRGEHGPRERVAAVQPVLAEHARAVDGDAAFPEEGLAALRGSGLLGLLVPVEYGGLGGTTHDLAECADALAGSCLSTAMIWAMHCQQVATVAAHASPELRERLLPRIARGELYLASVTSERGKGGHLLTARAALRRTGDRLIVRRDAPIVTGGLYADGFLITMRDAEDAPDEAVSLVYADRQDLTIEASGNWDPLGMRGTHSVALSIDGEVPAGNVVGEPGDFRTVAVTTLAPVGHLAWAACWLGAARAGLSGLLNLMRGPAGRRQFDLASELLRSRVARVRLRLDTVAALLSQCLAEVEGGGDLEAIPVQLRLNALKVVAAEECYQVADTLVELAGLRHGYLRDAPLPLERLLRDLRSASLNYANDRLLLANGALALLDREVHLAY